MEGEGNQGDANVSRPFSEGDVTATHEPENGQPPATTSLPVAKTSSSDSTGVPLSKSQGEAQQHDVETGLPPRSKKGATDAAPKKAATDAVPLPASATLPSQRIPKPRATRGVSWGDMKDEVDRSPGRPTAVATLKHADVVKNQISPSDLGKILDSPRSMNSPGTNSNSPHEMPGRGNNPRPKIAVVDILKVNPLETEAETLILSAIEDQELIQTRSRANTGTSTILSNVPSEATNIFKANTEPKADSPIVSRRKLTIDSTASPPQAEEKGKKLSSDRVIERLPLKRGQTLEQKLHGLTSALNAFQAAPNSSWDANAGFNQPEAMQVPEKPASALETLAQNANIIYRGKKDPKPPSIKSPTPSPAPSVTSGDGKGRDVSANERWKQIRTTIKVTNALGDSKKTDVETHDEGLPDMELDLPDIEGGEGATMDMLPGAQEFGDQIEEIEKTRSNRFARTIVGGAVVVKDMQTFVGQRRQVFITYCRFLLFLIIPLLGAALILFYPRGNPPTGRIDLKASINGTLINRDGEEVDPDQASTSWWLLFVIRQAITFSIAQMLQVIIIDYICLSTRTFVTFFGPWLTLLIVQSRGWPFLILMWGLVDFGLLSGNSAFASNWLYWQDFATIFTEENPSGSVPDSTWNRRVLLIGVSVGLIVSFKRLWLGLFLGRKTFANYAKELAKVMNKVLLLCEVGNLARDLEWQLRVYGTGPTNNSLTRVSLSREKLNGLVQSTTTRDDDSLDEPLYGTGISVKSFAQDETLDQISPDTGLIIDGNGVDPLTGGFTHSQKMKITELLGTWEEPEKQIGVEETISISAILQFRQSLAFIQNRFLFSIAWGDVSTREQMIACSQDVYQRLLLPTPESNVLNFEVIAKVAEDSKGQFDQEKLKDLIRLLRPARDGILTVLDFIKSIDAVYKEAKLLRAAVYSSEKIDLAFERVINIAFYTVMVCIILSQIGFDPLALFLSLSSIILAFAFMIGSASSKMFEGWLFILLRRPYDIGDRIHVSGVENDTDPEGSPGWIVQDVTLFTTTVVYGSTNERATLSNGSLASSRIINMARSPKAVLKVHLKFSTETPYQRIKLFEDALRKFVRARPREWASFVAFRAKNIFADLGYIEYDATLQHRESWQSVGALLDSKAQVASFCLELAKQLGMRYKSPPLPVDLGIVKRDGAGNETKSTNASTIQGDPDSDSVDIASLSAMFSLHGS